MSYILILKFQIAEILVPSILFRKNRKNRRIREKKREYLENVTVTFLGLDFRDQWEKMI